MQSLTSRLEGFIAASPSPPAAPAPPASPATAAAAAPPQPPPAPFSLPVSSAPVRLASPPKFSGESERRRLPGLRPSGLGAPRFVKQLKTFLKLCSVFLTRRLPHGKRLLLCSKSNRERRRVVDYALEFRTLAADSGWNETSIISAFIDGLAEEVKDFLAPLDIPRDFESLVKIASRIDNRLRERERETSAGSQVFGVPGGAALLP
ncbi:hypothetical protein L3Q82_001005 [Scortum barcoo]|uniref:Uncharacterized protein n=1 Tax=Scortum barcoo TaxID=214431 RepID=A0ACB8WB52_9TELE|nr:hypothetical protein L3Q82_001005 [Scortum barcoo]